MMVPSEKMKTSPTGNPASRPSLSSTENVVVMPVRERVHLRARLLSLVALAIALLLLSRGGVAAYRALTDSFVAPFILSPDNDALLQHRITLNRLLVERENLADRLREIGASIEVDDQAIRRLEDLLRHDAATNLRTLSTRQRTELRATLRGKEEYLTRLGQDLAAGLAHRSDFERERVAMHQLRAAVHGNTREQLSTHEMVMRLEVELLRRRADRNNRALELKRTQNALARMDEVLGQMRSRPLFRALDKSQHVAFVPYGELKGVQSGAPVFHCRLWSFLDCIPVGKVSEIVPGEVVTQDPWGSLARGQYAVLDLSDPAAARSKSLRVRRTGA